MSDFTIEEIRAELALLRVGVAAFAQRVTTMERLLARLSEGAASIERPQFETRIGEPQAGVYYCSFCGKSQHDVRKLVAGPTVFICDECVAICAEIVGEQKGAARAPEAT